MMILHLTTKTDWETAQRLSAYRAESLETQGFIHCSTTAQILGVANHFYRGVPALVLLWIDPEKVQAKVLWEDPVNPSTEHEGELPQDKTTALFPHIYGVINLDAVMRVVDFVPDPDGVFRQVPEGSD